MILKSLKKKHLFIGLMAMVLFFAPISLLNSDHKSIQISVSSTTVHALGVDTLVNISGLSTIPEKISEYFIKGVGNIILSIMGLLLGFAGFLLNEAIQLGVADLGGTLKNLEIIGTTWTLLRDFANMFFIFIFLYISISMILDIKKADTMRMLRNVILVAIFINFSLFFTKFLIDASNVTALAFYNQIPTSRNQTTGNVSISNAIMEAVRLQSIFSQTDNSASTGSLVNSAISGSENAGASIAKAYTDTQIFFVVNFIGAIFILLTACVFFAAAILFIIRLVVLIFVMILSPIALASIALPQFKKMIWDKWWGALWNQMLFAPAYMLLMYLSLSIVTSDGFITLIDLAPNASFVDALASASTGTVNIILNYVIVMAILIYALLTASSLSVAGAGFAQKWGGKLTFGAMGHLGRNTVGRLAYKLSENKDLLASAKNSSSARLLLSATKKAAGATYDPRNISKETKKMGIGSSLSKGYLGTIKAQQKEADAFAKNYKTPEDKAAFAASFATPTIWSRLTATTSANKIAAESIKKAADKELRKKRLPEFKAMIKAEREKLVPLDREIASVVANNARLGQVFATKEGEYADWERIKNMNTAMGTPVPPPPIGKAQAEQALRNAEQRLEQLKRDREVVNSEVKAKIAEHQKEVEEIEGDIDDDKFASAIKKALKDAGADAPPPTPPPTT